MCTGCIYRVGQKVSCCTLMDMCENNKILQSCILKTLSTQYCHKILLVNDMWT